MDMTFKKRLSLLIVTITFGALFVLLKNQKKPRLETVQFYRTFLQPYISSYQLSSPPNTTRIKCALELMSSAPTPPRRKEVRHVAFVKVHKAASSTLFNIFYRFGQKRELNFIIPRMTHTLGKMTSMRKGKIYPPPWNTTYDIACVHAVFEKAVFEAYLPNDTVYIATVREPFERLESAFWYYRNEYHIKYLTNINGSDPFNNFLSAPELYEPGDAYHSRTNNTMAKDFGFPPSQFRDIAGFKDYLNILAGRFELVLVKSLFPESVILMKRTLNWTLEDVLYITQNQLTYKPASKKREQQRTLAKSLLYLDYILYDFFLEKLKSRIREQDETFHEEVRYFKIVQKRVSDFCLKMEDGDGGKVLVIGRSSWNEAFQIDFCDCSNMMTKEIPAIYILKRVMEHRIEAMGPNNEFISTLPL